MLVMAMVSTGIFAVVLTARQNEVRSDRRQVAVVYAQQLNDVLQNYVGIDVDPQVGDATHGYTYFCAVCGAQCNSYGCPLLTGDSCTGNAFATGCWHTADSLLPTWFSGQPFLGHLCYNVTASGAFSTGLTLNNVQTKVTWATTTNSDGTGVDIPCP